MEQLAILHLNGSKAGQTEYFPYQTAAELLIGRDSRASISFDPAGDGRVSRRHAMIRVRHRRDHPYSIIDLQSRNGTFVNGRRVEGECDLNPRDIIEIGAGGPRLLFDVEDAAGGLADSHGVADLFASAASPLSFEAIIKGFSTYWATVVEVAACHRGYARQQSCFTGPKALPRAVAVYIFGATLSYIIALPIMIKADSVVDKMEFILEVLYFQAIFIAAIHVAIRIARGQGRLLQTACAYLTWMGVALPFYIIGCNPDAYLRPLTILIAGPAAGAASAAVWGQVWAVLPAALLIAVTWLVPVHWLVQIHRVRAWRLGLALVLVCLPIVAFHDALIAPTMQGLLHNIATLLKQLI